jgi:hypothetical protein
MEVPKNRLRKKIKRLVKNIDEFKTGSNIFQEIRGNRDLNLQQQGINSTMGPLVYDVTPGYCSIRFFLSIQSKSITKM